LKYWSNSQGFSKVVFNSQNATDMIFYIFEKLDHMQLKHLIFLKHFKKHIRKYKHTHSLFFLLYFTHTHLQLYFYKSSKFKIIQLNMFKNSQINMRNCWEFKNSVGMLLSCRNNGDAWISSIITTSGAWTHMSSPIKTRKLVDQKYLLLFSPLVPMVALTRPAMQRKKRHIRYFYFFFRGIKYKFLKIEFFFSLKCLTHQSHILVFLIKFDWFWPCLLPPKSLITNVIIVIAKILSKKSLSQKVC